MSKRIEEMPVVDQRVSTYELDTLISQLSSINTEESGVYNDFAEVFLCLANEIKDLKNKL